MKVLALFTMIFAFCISAHAQTDDEKEVRQAAMDYIESVYNVNPVQAERSVHPELVKRGFFIKKGESFIFTAHDDFQ